MERRLTKAFASGHWAIDWWEGDPRGLAREDLTYIDEGFYVRPACVGVAALRDASWSGKCNFLGAAGCQLPREQMPLGCRMLEPKWDKCKGALCVPHGGGKQEMAVAWLPYHDVLERAAKASGREE